LYAEITAQLATARQRMLSEREKLIRWMGLWGSDLAFKIPDTLPSMPRRPRVLPAVEIEAVQRRVDIQIARLELDALAKSHGLTQATRFVNLLEVAGIDRRTKERATGETIKDRGFELEFQIPIFDFGEVRARDAEHKYLQAVNRLAEKAVNARSQAREAYRNYRATYDIAAHYRREVLPLRKIISDEMLLRYNAMQIDVFALLTEVRQRTASLNASVDAQRDFWLASVDLATAVMGGGAGSGGEGSSMTAPAPAESAGGH
jgi:outer membrane protein TolC